jgi:hypothetical protein
LRRRPNDAVLTRGFSLTRLYERPTRGVLELVEHEFQPHSGMRTRSGPLVLAAVDSGAALACSVLNYGEPGNVPAA